MCLAAAVPEALPAKRPARIAEYDEMPRNVIIDAHSRAVTPSMDWRYLCKPGVQDPPVLGRTVPGSHAARVRESREAGHCTVPGTNDIEVLS